jgi:CelD/BcsL family acetyltransferase involved in cellulose biosynthesis
MIQKLTPTPDSKRLLSTHVDDTPRHEFSVRMIESEQELEAIVPAWQRLLETAVHRNLMLDPDFLIPAIKHLSEDSVQVLVVEAPQKSNPDAPPVMCGLLPLKRPRGFRASRSDWEVWMHDQCVDGTPLLREDCAAETLDAIFDHLTVSEKSGLLRLDMITNEGRFAQVLTDVLHARGLPVCCRDSYTRACFRPELDAETYCQKHVSKSVAKTQRRLSRRMDERGAVSVVAYRDAESAEPMIEHFLRLEASGWKGESGTALKSQTANRKFFQEMVRRSMSNDKLSFLTLKLDNQPIAMLCDLYSGAVGYSFKTAFDDALGEFSPGMMIELRNIEYMHDLGVDCVDSCTMPNNQTINRIWGQRLRFQNVTIPLGGRWSRLKVAAMPLLKEMRDVFFRWKAR